MGKKLHSAGDRLVTLLTALEYLFKREEKLNSLQRASIERQLGVYPQQLIDKALAQWPLWFREEIAPLLKATTRAIIGSLPLTDKRSLIARSFTDATFACDP